MSWFRRKAEVVDAQHLLKEIPPVGTTPTDTATTGSSSADPGVVVEVGGGGTTSASPPGDFRLTVSDVFSIKGRGTVVTGKVEAGSISVGAEIAITRNGQSVRRTKVTGVEMFRKTMVTAVAGQEVGLLLDGVERTDVASGDVLTA